MENAIQLHQRLLQRGALPLFVRAGAPRELPVPGQETLVVRAVMRGIGWRKPSGRGRLGRAIEFRAVHGLWVRGCGWVVHDAHAVVCLHLM